MSVIVEDKIEFTLEYFNEQICAFRKLFCGKDFWSKAEDYRELALKAITFTYLNVKTKTDKENEQLHSIYKANIDEYTRRATMMFMLQVEGGRRR